MSDNLITLYENYLDNIGYLPNSSLGSDYPNKVTRVKNDLFIQQINKQSQFNDRIIYTSLILMGMIILIGLIIIFLFHDNSFVVVAIFILITISVFLILSRLKQFWLEKNLIQMSIGLMSDLPPKEAVVYIRRIYLQLLQPNSKQVINDITNEISNNPVIHELKEYNDTIYIIRKKIGDDNVRGAIEKLQELVRTSFFSGKMRNKLIIFSNELTKIEYNQNTGIYPEETKAAYVSLIDRILKTCDEIDDKIDASYM